jgi:hypothetical protein
MASAKSGSAVSTTAPACRQTSRRVLGDRRGVRSRGHGRYPRAAPCAATNRLQRNTRPTLSMRTTKALSFTYANEEPLACPCALSCRSARPAPELTTVREQDDFDSLRRGKATYAVTMPMTPATVPMGHRRQKRPSQEDEGDEGRSRSRAPNRAWRGAWPTGHSNLLHTMCTRQAARAATEQ